jgi:hypothetical protein
VYFEIEARFDDPEPSASEPNAPEPNPPGNE